MTELGRAHCMQMRRIWSLPRFVSTDFKEDFEEEVDDAFKKSIAVDVLEFLLDLTEVNDTNHTRLTPRITIETRKTGDEGTWKEQIWKTLKLEILGDDCPRCSHQGRNIDPPNIITCARCHLIEKDAGLACPC